LRSTDLNVTMPPLPFLSTAPEDLSSHQPDAGLSRRAHEDGSLEPGEIAAWVLAPLLLIGFLALWMYCVYTEYAFFKMCCQTKKNKKRCADCGSHVITEQDEHKSEHCRCHHHYCAAAVWEEPTRTKRKKKTKKQQQQQQTRCECPHRRRRRHTCGSRARQCRCPATPHLLVCTWAHAGASQEETPPPHRYTRMIGGEHWVWPRPPRKCFDFGGGDGVPGYYGDGGGPDFTYWDGCEWRLRFDASRVRYSPYRRRGADTYRSCYDEPERRRWGAAGYVGGFQGPDRFLVPSWPAVAVAPSSSSSSWVEDPRVHEETEDELLPLTAEDYQVDSQSEDEDRTSSPAAAAPTSSSSSSLLSPSALSRIRRTEAVARNVTWAASGGAVRVDAPASEPVAAEDKPIPRSSPTSRLRTTENTRERGGQPPESSHPPANEPGETKDHPQREGLRVNTSHPPASAPGVTGALSERAGQTVEDSHPPAVDRPSTDDRPPPSKASSAATALPEGIPVNCPEVLEPQEAPTDTGNPATPEPAALAERPPEELASPLGGSPPPAAGGPLDHEHVENVQEQPAPPVNASPP